MWRKKSVTYVEVQCKHEIRLVNLDNLKRGKQLGCQLCYLERNNLPIFKSENERNLWYRFRSIVLRCTNPSTHGYNTYKTVKIHKEWIKNPMSFVQYVQTLLNFSIDLTLDRIDNTKGYEPGNLRWATPKEQANNRKDTKYVNYQNNTIPLSEFIEKYSKYSATHTRWLIQNGHSPEECAVRTSYHTNRSI